MHSSADSGLLCSDQKSSLQWKKPELLEMSYKIKLNLLQGVAPVSPQDPVQGGEARCLLFPSQFIHQDLESARGLLRCLGWLRRPWGLWGSWRWLETQTQPVTHRRAWNRVFLGTALPDPNRTSPVSFCCVQEFSLHCVQGFLALWSHGTPANRI